MHTLVYKGNSADAKLAWLCGKAKLVIPFCNRYLKGLKGFCWACLCLEARPELQTLNSFVVANKLGFCDVYEFLTVRGWLMSTVRASH